MEYYVYITNGCNMNCKYCSVLFDAPKFGVPMSPQYSFKELEYFVTKMQNKLNDKVADIYFFGGEPTIDYLCIEKLIQAFSNSHDYKVNFIMHTNGLLIPAAPQHILEKIDVTLLSINYELIHENGHVTQYFNQILNAIDCLKKANRNPIIGRITVSPNTCLFTECCLISNFVDYIYWQIDNCITDEKYDDYYKRYTFEISLLYRYWMECLKKGVFLSLVPFLSAIKNLISNDKIPQKFYCGYGSSMIYIQTNGNCYACCDNVVTNSHYLGDIFSGITLPEISLKNTICQNCSYIKLCGGRCGRMHKDFSEERKKMYCNLNQYTFDLIISNIEEIKEIIALNPDYYNRIMDPMLSYTEYTS